MILKDQNKAATLLEHFGSIAQLARGSVQELLPFLPRAKAAQLVSSLRLAAVVPQGHFGYRAMGVALQELLPPKSRQLGGHSPIPAIVYAKEPDFWNKGCQVKSTDTGSRRCLLSWRGIGTDCLFVLSPRSGFFLSPVCRSWERPVDGSSDKLGGWSIRFPPRRLTS